MFLLPKSYTLFTWIMKSPIATLDMLKCVWQHVSINLRARKAQRVVFQIG